MKKSMTAIAVLMLLSVFLSACNLSAANPTQIGPDQINTIAAQTVEALTTQMAPPPATATNTPEPPTATPQVTETPTLAIPTLNLTPGALATNTLIPIATLPGSTECNKVFFLSDVNVPDGTVFKPETKFTKTWKIQNSGSCTWTSLYSAVPFSNDPTSPSITGDNEFKVKANVMPGGILEVTVVMVAPKEEGTYTQVWKMQDDQGNYFGIGGPNGAGWYVNIKVDKSGGSASTTGIKLASTVSSVSPNSGPAGSDVQVDGNVTISGLASGKSQFVRWTLRIAGQSMGCGGEYTFTDNGSKSFSYTNCKVPAGLAEGDKSVQVYINEPGGSNTPTGFTFSVTP